MATRLYLSNAAPGYTPTTKRGGWTVSSATLARALATKSGAAATASGTGLTTSGQHALIGRWISSAFLSGGTFGGGISWVVGAIRTSNMTGCVARLYVYATTGDSDTPRGTALTYNGGTAWTTTATGRGGSTTLTDVTVQAGDRIVVELGLQLTGASTAAATGTVNYGNTGATDLTSGSTSVTTQPGWVEFAAIDSLFLPSRGGDFFPFLS